MPNCNVCNSDKLTVQWEAQVWCVSCRSKEMRSQTELEESADDRVAAMEESVLDRQIRVDTTIKLSKDTFNANTVSTVEMKEAIYADDSLSGEEKLFEYAKRMKDRILTFGKAIFEHDKERLELTSGLREAQQHYTDLCNKLRKEEREELRAKDLTYKPPKPVKPSKPRAPKKRKFDKTHKESLRIVSAELNVDISTIQGICVGQNLNPVEAGTYLKELQAKFATDKKD